MRNDIKGKFAVELNKKISEESQVVYILSRIRKILEIDGTESVYKILKFYCDWALHAQIDNTQPVMHILGGLFEGNLDNLLDFGNFKSFYKELALFLRKSMIETTFFTNSESKTNFSRLLIKIYSDTPLVVKEIKKWKIVLVADDGTSFSIKKVVDV